MFKEVKNDNTIFVPPEFVGSQSAPLPKIIQSSTRPSKITAPEMIKGAGLKGALIAFDVDGTLITHDGEIEQDVIDGLKELESRGARIIVATGRSIPAVMPILGVLNLKNEWVVCSNGAVTIRMKNTKIATPDLLQHDATRALQNFNSTEHYDIIETITFDPSEVIEILHQLLPNALIGVEDIGHGFRTSKPFPDGELIGTEKVVGLEALKQEPVSRVIVRAPEMEVHDFKATLSKVNIEPIPWDVGWTAWLDVAPPFTTKASALQKLANSLRVIRARCIAVGDGTNDESMISWAGWGIAMGQSEAKTQAKADTVVNPVEQGGALQVIEALLED